MSRAFADICFTASVKAAQSRYGSRAGNTAFERASDPHNAITLRDADFIASRDSFYQASVSEDGWPYVQHRGGPPGFLRVLDARTLGYADYRGNRQYISVGNITADARVALILMDYPHQARLKIWGRARVVHADEDAPLLARLATPASPTNIERAIVIHVEALEWNCPQHITPRYTEAELGEEMRALTEENRRLRARLEALKGGTS